MRLIDAQDVFTAIDECENNAKEKGEFETLIGVAVLKTMLGTLFDSLPEADPVHAAGGCYCRECEQFALARVNKKGFLICPVTGMDIGENDFCSFGRRKESRCEKD